MAKKNSWHRYEEITSLSPYAGPIGIREDRFAELYTPIRQQQTSVGAYSVYYSVVLLLLRYPTSTAYGPTYFREYAFYEF